MAIITLIENRKPSTWRWRQHLVLLVLYNQAEPKKLMVSISKQHLMIIISLTNKSVLLTLLQCKGNVLSKGKEEA
jgi:hypothetical protein